MVKIFLWRVGNELLPTKRNLFLKKIVENPLCLICLREEEFVIHALWLEWCSKMEMGER